MHHFLAAITFTVIWLPCANATSFDGPHETPWSHVSEGVPIPDIQGAMGKPQYSPSGTQIAFQSPISELYVLDIATGSYRLPTEELLGAREWASTTGYWWLSDDRILTREYWALRDRPEVDLGSATIPAGFCTYQILNLTTCARETVFDYYEVGGDVVGVINNCWVVSGGAQYWLFDPSSGQTVDAVAADTSEDSRLAGIQNGWLRVLLLPDEANPAASEFGVVFRRLYEGETIATYDLPPAHGPILLLDRTLLGSTFHWDTGRSEPIIIDTSTQLRRFLPETESWRPVAVCPARQVVLAELIAPRDGKLSTSYVEIPFSALGPN